VLFLLAHSGGIGAGETGVLLLAVLDALLAIGQSWVEGARSGERCYGVATQVIAMAGNRKSYWLIRITMYMQADLSGGTRRSQFV